MGRATCRRGPPSSSDLRLRLAVRRRPPYLVAILLAYLALASGYALGTPRWNNPDEPAHYNYVAQVARTGQLPVLEAGDWDSERLAERLTSGRFSTDQPVDDFRYEGHQPPLYYLLMALPYRLAERLGSNARVVALRWVSIGLGLLVILVVYAAGRVLAPQRAELAPLAAGIVAFIPMHTAMTAAINNDTLAELMGSATLLAILIGLRRGFGPPGALAVGALGGGLLLTKLTVYVFAPLVFLALALGGAAPIGPGKPYRWRRAVCYVALAALVTAALSGWWFLRNLSVYGWPDLFGLIRHDRVVVGQPRWGGMGDQLESVRFFLYSMFRSFWAQFGWMAVVVDPQQERPYWLFLLFTVLTVGGLVRFWRSELQTWPAAARLGLRFLLAGLGVAVGEVVLYNLSFVQAQGRYLYPAILPLGVLFALGWSSAVLPPSPARAPDHGGKGAGYPSFGWLGFGLGFYWVWAAGAEAVSWLLAQAPAPLPLHALTIGPTWLATKVQVWRSRQSLAGIAAAALLIVLALVDAAALLRFVVPYFQGW